MLSAADRSALTDLLPLLRRAVTLDPRTLVRLRLTGGAQTQQSTATAVLRLPFDVLVSRTVRTRPRNDPLDTTVAAGEAVAWMTAGSDSDGSPPPPARDVDWRDGLPPAAGWQRVDSVPDQVVRALVRSGALALKDAAAREGVPGAQPRAEVAGALLDSTVLTVHGDALEAAVTLRALSALTRMGFLPRGGEAHVDVSGRWIRVVGEHGSVHLERPGQRLLLR